uniref:Zinc finger, CCHC-type n=1 Tax=Tanacetum cinerariifolium TaxID=118510 RepID=A0A6L2LCC3_TANCI|nr:zinc finger, CCHC-type [Tanacetum cinerariifolium]
MGRGHEQRTQSIGSQQDLGTCTAMRNMASNFAKLDKFKGVDFRRWQKKMHFLLSSMSVVYVLTTSIPDDGDDATAKYMAEDASSKKLLVSNFSNYKITYSRPVMEQYNELLGILKSHLRIEESLRMQDSDKPKGNNVASPLVVNMVEHNNSSRYNDNKGKCKHHDNTKADPNKKSKVTCWKCRKHGHLKKDCKGGKVGNKANGSGTNVSVDGSTNSLKVSINSIIESRDAIFNENKFSSVLRPSFKILNRTEDIGGSVVLEEVTKEVVTQQPKPELKKGKMNRTPKDFRPKFHLYLIKGTRDEVSDQQSCCFNVEDEPKTFNEAMKS